MRRSGKPHRRAGRPCRREMALGLLLLLASCTLDPWGWLVSSDVDVRFDESRTLGQPAGLSPALPYSFVVIADTHINGSNYAAQFGDLASHLLASDAFVLVCGDLVQNGARADMESFKTVVPGLLGGLPVYAVPGNHDMYNNGWEPYRELIGPGSYTFPAGTIGLHAVRFIALDTASGTLGAKQRAWLEASLAARTEEHCVVFTHMQVFCPDITETQQLTDPEEILWLMNLLEKNNAEYLFMGHAHKDLERLVKGTDFCMVGTYRTSYIRVTVSATGISKQYFNL
jgi:3',5'-cyclic AMP phosphodiesterase CpdA